MRTLLFISSSSTGSFFFNFVSIIYSLPYLNPWIFILTLVSRRQCAVLFLVAMTECLPWQWAALKALQVSAHSQHQPRTDKILSGSELSHYQSGTFINLSTELENQKEEPGIIWSPIKKLSWGSSCLRDECADIFFLEQLSHVFFRSSRRGWLFGWAVYPAGKLKHTKGLKFPLILFSLNLFFFFFCTETEGALRSISLQACWLAVALCSFVLFLLSVKEVCKPC